MAVLRWIFLLIVVGAIVGFALQNEEQTVTVTLGWYQSPPIPLFLAIYIAFGTGIILYFLFSLSFQLRIRGELSRFRREYTRVKDELNHLRNVNLDKEIEGFYKNQPTMVERPVAESKSKSIDDDTHGWGA